MDALHVSVLLHECIENLNIRPDGIYVDGTLGMGGHSEQIAARLTTGKLIGIDRDETAIERAGARLAPFGDRVQLVHGNSRDAAAILDRLGIDAVDGMLFDLGAERVVSARELTLDELADLRSGMPKEMELECFVHGAMCVSYSGRCLLSNYLTDRHSNKGECSQPCRWEYSLMERTRQGEYFPVEETASGTYIMNSKDMCMIEHIPELIEAGVSSFKIEGRAKTKYYTAVVTNAYRSAVDAYLAAPSNDFKPAQWMVDEVYKISHRDYCTGFFFGSPRDDAQIYYKGGYVRSWEVAAIAVKSENGTLTVSQRNRFFEGDKLEIMNRGKEPTVITVRNLRNSLGESVDNAPNPMAEFTFDCDADVPAGAFIRRSTDEK